MMNGFLSFTTAAHEFVVPRSMPMIGPFLGPAGRGGGTSSTGSGSGRGVERRSLRHGAADELHRAQPLRGRRRRSWGLERKGPGLLIPDDLQLVGRRDLGLGGRTGRTSRDGAVDRGGRGLERSEG